MNQKSSPDYATTLVLIRLILRENLLGVEATGAIKREFSRLIREREEAQALGRKHATVAR